ncbi:MAG: hypothetical protein HW421_2261 [Ignavibacteria bacterium]|nr:hypothetical protein [Ignavibacteria bacterium]
MDFNLDFMDNTSDESESMKNPFAEEFSSADVVNRPEKDKDKRKGNSYSEKPFSEEFSRDDVVNRRIDDYQPQRGTGTVKVHHPGSRSDEIDEKIVKRLLKDYDVDMLVESIVKLEDDFRRDKSFKKDPKRNEPENITDENRRMLTFNDYLLAPKISGKVSDLPHSSRIPKEFAQPGGEKVEIKDDPSLDSPHKKTSTALINRNEDGIIESIEVFCNCGERTLIKFDFEDVDDSLGESEYEEGVESHLGFDVVREGITEPEVSIEDLLEADGQKSKPDSDADVQKDIGEISFGTDFDFQM